MNKNYNINLKKPLKEISIKEAGRIIKIGFWKLGKKILCSRRDYLTLDYDKNQVCEIHQKIIQTIFALRLKTYN